MLEFCRGTGRKGKSGLFLVCLALVFQLRPRSRDGEAVLIQQLLDAKNVFHVAAPVHALTSAAFYGLELWKFSLPEAENVGRQSAEACDFPYTEVEFVGNDNVVRVPGFSRGFLLGAHPDPTEAARLKEAKLPPAFSSTTGGAEQLENEPTRGKGLLAGNW